MSVPNNREPTSAAVAAVHRNRERVRSKPSRTRAVAPYAGTKSRRRAGSQKSCACPSLAAKRAIRTLAGVERRSTRTTCEERSMRAWIPARQRSTSCRAPGRSSLQEASPPARLGRSRNRREAGSCRSCRRSGTPSSCSSRRRKRLPATEPPVDHSARGTKLPSQASRPTVRAQRSPRSTPSGPHRQVAARSADPGD